MWNIVIEDSRTLRKVRFLEPIEPREQVIRRPRFRSGIRMSKWVPGQDTECWVPSELHPAFYKAVARAPRQFAPHIGPLGWDLSCQIHVQPLSSLRAWVSENNLHKALICQPPCKRLRCWTLSPSPPNEVFHSATGVTFQDLVDLANSRNAETHTSSRPCVHFSLLDVTNVTDDENKARIDTARRKYERRELVAQKKLAVKENRKGLDKISVFDRSEECDLSALFEEYSLEN
ncbi:hypothetical protein CB0940_06221 [Cercospora beticola]|nr:hypothetical protein CB0940_06221 [Cercospora beticola]PIA97746.1 hypothetical protein CB0940_06221 [Cercospora beticola]